MKKVGDSCCTQLLILTKSSCRLPAHLRSSCAAQRSCSSLGWKTHVVRMCDVSALAAWLGVGLGLGLRLGLGSG